MEADMSAEPDSTATELASSVKPCTLAPAPTTDNNNNITHQMHAAIARHERRWMSTKWGTEKMWSFHFEVLRVHI